MKGQSLVIQFVIFFLIGFSLFLSVGSFFRYQSDLFREDIISYSLSSANSYISSNMVVAVDSCKQCDYISLSVPMSNLTAGYVIEINLKNSGLNVSMPYKYFSSSAHNLNSSFSLSGKSSSVQPITLTFNRNQNKLEVS
jgi:hypothetical protein